MPTITFADTVSVMTLTARTAERPSPGDYVQVFWDTTEEPIWPHKVKGWFPAMIVQVPEPTEDGELTSAPTSWHLFYPSNTLQAIYMKQHPGMHVHQNMDKMGWKWFSPSDEWEYMCRGECALVHG